MFEQALIIHCPSIVIPATHIVIPAEAGIHSYCAVGVDPRLRGDDNVNSALSPDTILAGENILA